MMTWNEEMVIEANIEVIWNLFQLENIQRIMPQIIENEVIEMKEGIVGSRYRQKYQEGKRVETYIVEDLAHEDTPERKHNTSGFVLAKAFKIETSFTLEKIDEKSTRFIYSGTNQGINFLGKILMKLSSSKNNDKVVADFMKRVETEALKDSH
ncbi:SRPBCC family protein [Listeria booriae]|uniref:SRPBCC family protein n=1 Tax=Listeria booriae TaxID=1552123 RepID=A0A7X1CK26_9LIST|nr:SRPBCC family protein [Listeria booriae]MBC1232141.1 SRPBCC family protein [Listeria booriae]MBC1293354.1 SRPBCC family protein [Listeria booriae]MBC1309386.1 SRPBCC family protein [Listeria booriae]MBC1493465.1 SRPBCC family protein [Listeria booriae]MBC1504943.1 SRPBCC family protein [Listeria booriae]